MPRKSSSATPKATTSATSPMSNRRFTPYSFKSPFKRRKAEKGLARTNTAGSFRLLGRAIIILRNHWEIFGGLFLIYALLNTLLTAGSLLQIDLEGARARLSLVEGVSDLGVGLVLVETLFSAGVGTATGPNGSYQTILVLVMSLAMVWALRQLTAGNKLRVRDALYNSCYPLVQVLLVLVMVFVHLIPVTIASFLVYSLLIMGIITVGWQQALVGIGCFLLLVWSVYLLVGSVIALYVATLPGMTPLQALRSAKDIVRYRRGMVLRKLLFLPLVLLLLTTLIVLPLSLLLPVAATVVFYILGMMYVPLIHAYIYSLYRELIAG